MKPAEVIIGAPLDVKRVGTNMSKATKYAFKGKFDKAAVHAALVVLDVALH